MTTDAYKFCPFCDLRVVEMCKTFQTSVREMSQRYFSRLRRHNYVTPTSYLELILTFKTLLNVKRNEVNTARNRYIVGLQKLEFAASQVKSFEISTFDFFDQIDTVFITTCTLP